MKPTSLSFRCGHHLCVSLASSLRVPHLTRRRSFVRLGAACLWVPWLLGLAPAAGAATFTQDTVIGYTNLAYDGQEIVVTNCTLTVDGAHGFLSVHVLNGGILTHTAVPSAVPASNFGPPVYGAQNLVVSNNVEVEIGGAIDANGKGYVSGLGQGGGTSQLTNFP